MDSEPQGLWRLVAKRSVPKNRDRCLIKYKRNWDIASWCEESNEFTTHYESFDLKDIDWFIILEE